MLELRPTKGNEPVEVTLVYLGLLNSVLEPACGGRVSYVLELVRSEEKRNLLVIADSFILGAIRQIWQCHIVQKPTGPRLACHRWRRPLNLILGSKQVDLGGLLPVHLGDGALTDVDGRPGPLLLRWASSPSPVSA